MSRNKIIVLIGAPGAGKGTQARLLEANLGMKQISTGDMFREIEHSDTPFARQVKEILASGTLVTDEVTFGMVQERTAQDDCLGTYILDGFPRTPTQAEMLETLADSQGKSILAILIDVPFGDLEKRLTGRRRCPKCGEIYNIYSKPPKIDGFCDRDPDIGLEQRSDDTLEKVKVRLETYIANTKPLLKYYDESGRLEKVDGTLPPDQIYETLAKIVGTDNAA